MLKCSAQQHFSFDGLLFISLIFLQIADVGYKIVLLNTQRFTALYHIHHQGCVTYWWDILIYLYSAPLNKTEQ